MNTLNMTQEEKNATRHQRNIETMNRIRLSETQNRRDMQKAYSEANKEAMRLVKRIERAIVNQPATPTQWWASVGSAQHLVEELKQISDMLYNEGEYAETA